ncbi:MAG: molybdate ABC transporter permease subunit [Myxococcales bacterium]|nr:molybdate ABC transporter permease subunit [Myxococcales bacterium]
MSRRAHPLGLALAAALVAVLALPLLALALAASPADLRAGLQSPLFAPALWLSLRTTLLSLALIVLCGTPLAWWLATTRARLARIIELLVELPIVVPPAVLGVALLYAFGRRGLLGPALAALDLAVPFTEAAVLLAQIVVAAPFYVQAAANAFRKVEPDLLIVARTLGASPTAAFFRVAVPVALPGLIVGGLAIAWARALGEFGATLLFAGNLTGRTQTMPLAIFTALESDVRVALVFALVLAALGALLLLALRFAPAAWRRMRRGAP